MTKSYGPRGSTREFVILLNEFVIKYIKLPSVNLIDYNTNSYKRRNKTYYEMLKSWNCQRIF